MPVDRFRNTCPSLAVDLKHFLSTELRKDQLSSDLVISEAVIPNAKGSAEIKYGYSHVFASIHGPIEVSRRADVKMEGQLDVFVKLSPFVVKIGLKNEALIGEKELATLVKESITPCIILDSYTKCRFELHFLIVEYSSGVLASLLLAANVAMMNAGIEMRDFLSAWTDFDTNIADSSSNCAALSLGYMPNLKQIVMVYPLAGSDLRNRLEHAINGCVQNYHTVCQHLAGKK